ncbi:MAG: HDOD domain-containing protein [Verrucomicrobiota bacterium]
MATPDLAYLISELPELGSCAHIYNELSKSLNDPSAAVGSFGRIIEKDPALMAKLLRLANSAFFGYPSSIKTLDDAMIIIGIQQVRDLVAATTVIEYFKDVSPDLVNMNSFWEHSMACGIAARILAGYRRNWNPEQSFAAGIMHDLGRLVMLIRLPEQMRDILNRCQNDPRPIYNIEREVMGYDHAEVGGVLLECWNFPQSLANAVRYHHEPTRSAQDFTDAALVHLGDIIAHAMEFGSSGEKHVPHCDSQVWAKLEMDTEILRPSMREIDRQFSEIVNMFMH